MSQPLKIFMKESICPPTDVCVCSYLCSITALIDCSIIQILRPIKKKKIIQILLFSLVLLYWLRTIMDIVHIQVLIQKTQKKSFNHH